MTIFLLVRHASNDFVKEGRLAGWTPGVHINAQGQREADELARRLAHIPMQAIYSSPLERAVDTATAVAACQKLPVQIRADLGEGRIGEWTGKLIKELQETEAWKAMQATPIGFKPPGDAESIDQVQTRIVAEVERIRRAHPEGIVAVVSHADPLKTVIAHYLKWDLKEFQRISINPASVSVLMVDEDHAHLERLNDTGKLPTFEKKKTEKQEAAKQEAQGAEVGAEREPAAARKDEEKMAEANVIYDLNPVSRLAAGAVGEPGQRVFYLQARQGATLVTLLAEKEQIASLSAGIVDMLVKLGERAEAETRTSPYDVALEEPLGVGGIGDLHVFGVPLDPLAGAIGDVAEVVRLGQRAAVGEIAGRRRAR